MGEEKRKAETILNGARKACGGCEYFRRGQVGQAMGVCRGAPPVPMVVGMGQDMSGKPVPIVNTYWPQVPDSEVCGHWERKVDLAAIDLTKLDLEEAVSEGTA